MCRTDLDIHHCSCVFTQEHNGYCVFLKTFLLHRWSCKKQSGERAKALYPDERVKDRPDLSGISWALGATIRGYNSFWPFYFPALGYAYKPKTQFQTSLPFIQRRWCPKPLLLCHSGLSAHTSQFSLQTDWSRLAARHNCGRWKQKHTNRGRSHP